MNCIMSLQEELHLLPVRTNFLLVLLSNPEDGGDMLLKTSVDFSPMPWERQIRLNSKAFLFGGEVQVHFSLCLNKHQALKTYGGVKC
jgi:hypothetical protein